MNNRPQRNRPGRAQVLREWRGIDLAPLEEARTLRCRPLTELLPRVLKNLGLDRRRAEAEIVRVWNDLIDPVLTAHAQPAGIVKGTLFVNVDSSVWLDEIVRYRRREILDRLKPRPSGSEARASEGQASEGRAPASPTLP